MPLGILQLYTSVNQGYFAARTLKFVTSDVNTLLEWLRMSGDILFIVGGVLPLLYLCWQGVCGKAQPVMLEESEGVLFTPVTHSITSATTGEEERE